MFGTLTIKDSHFFLLDALLGGAASKYVPLLTGTSWQVHAVQGGPQRAGAKGKRQKTCQMPEILFQEMQGHTNISNVTKMCCRC